VGTIPTTAPSGYHQVFADDFNRSSLGSNWLAYAGQAGSDVGSWWDPSHVQVANGQLILRTYQDPSHYGGAAGYPPWVEGGVSLGPGLQQTYGEYLVRSRVTSATGVTQVALLWPASGSWPPEVDFNESYGSNGSSEATLHWGSNAATHQQQVATVSVDLTRWHTWGVILSPGKVVYTLDGAVWATMNTNPVPTIPMILDLQQQVWGCGEVPYEACPSAATPSEVDMEVDWVVAYAPS
jgi:Glycosyl hydrolases family 16